MYCASFKKKFPQDFAGNVAAHTLLAKVAIFRVDDIKNQFKFWMNSGNQEVIGWVQQENSQIKNDGFVNTITELTKAAIAKRTQNTGMGFSTGMGGQPQSGMGMPNQSMGMGMQQSTGMGMQQSTGMGMGMQQQSSGMQASNSAADSMGLNTQPVIKPNTMTSMSPEAVVPTPAPVQEVKPTTTIQSDVKVEGNRLIGDTNNPQFSELLKRQFDKVGGWEVNPTEGFDKSDVLDVKSFRWNSKYGVLTQENKVMPCTYNQLDEYIDKIEQHFDNQLEKLQESYPKLDVNDASSEGFMAYSQLVNKYTRAKNDELSQREFGSMTGSDTVVAIGTKPWMLNISILDAAMEIFGERTLTLIEEDTYIVVINNREYILLDSSDAFTNTLVASKRSTYRNNWSRADNRSVKGHYYLINHYLTDVDGGPVIEDFYIGEEGMNPENYHLEENSPSFKTDVIDEDGNVATEALVVNPTDKFVVRDLELSLMHYTPIQVAEALRTEAANKRIGEWGRSILKGSTSQFNYHLATSKKDRQLLTELNELLDKGDLRTVMDLGDWLVSKREEGVLTLRTERFIDGTVMKELNTVFNDVLMFEGLIIDVSFIDEYVELIEYLQSENTPNNIKVLFAKMEYFILRKVLLPQSINPVTEQAKSIIKHYNTVTPYKVTNSKDGGNIRLEEGADPLKLVDVLLPYKETTVVYALPSSMQELGLNPHAGTLSVPWTVLNADLLDEIKKHFTAAYTLETIVLVTTDNYVVRVSGSSDEMLSGTLSIVV
ncbi:hypothetical protein TSMG0038 [Halocynthia phage JM-2012]|uniref:hypothetical protein n=1 Tax=Halocynthia phage JM-2012 TaxID=1173297 RepID=UPI00025C68F5|nr:hypothetical protein TSMG0038 [Halocynthia phage JM-2012]AFI55321.1 hypothetical protein TSMG0038 [Halocynthia phage JM-2012]